ncbi:hypothetical protein BCR41DRAFT_356946 [Lobosporangium transversale]|uniref:Uncharacterized protein n=1 Tax=Lobosporangium transversale TaxID=64571 RepID=A0A1Y2GHT2_9FUNG|nr:hypothetical protein BCR41DRAFT_356946 [Lobosporangium transversale]ORZ11266.1 hypothetical protein BCR41DRAFT_356946 [Lobosporangium transversale]|eukprot:XP_021879581.1 hypothetical protein BCR41DRAFT_356946 [Lobosporangium transversale]
MLLYSTISVYRTRLAQEWPRLVVALVSVYGICYSISTIQTSNNEIHKFEQLNDLSRFSFHKPSPTFNPVSIAYESSQLAFSSSIEARKAEPSTGADTDDSSSRRGRRPNPGTNSQHQSEFSKKNNAGVSSNKNNSPQRSPTSTKETRGNFKKNGFRNFHSLLPLVSQMLLVRNPDLVNFDYEGTELVIVYTLLVMSSLSIIDNAIGLMVATRRSLRLTQVAFAIWCLRFLFRILSLVSILFMLTAGTKFRKFLLSSNIGFHGGDSNGLDDLDALDGDSADSNGNIEASRMIILTTLEVIIAAVHGWSLLVLIRDLRNQPRPRTIVSQIWVWFCETRWGQHLGIGRWIGASYDNFDSISGIISNNGNGGGETGSIYSLDASHGGSGVRNGLLSSASSIYSIAVSPPEMAGVVAVTRSRASSICSFNSVEKT